MRRLHDGSASLEDVRGLFTETENVAVGIVSPGAYAASLHIPPLRGWGAPASTFVTWMRLWAPHCHPPLCRLRSPRLRVLRGGFAGGLRVCRSTRRVRSCQSRWRGLQRE